MSAKSKIGLCLLLVTLLLLLSACAARPSAPTPTPSPTPAPTPEPTPYVDYRGMLQISELMAKNRASLTNAEGEFPDWVELRNLTADPVSLQGWALSDEAGVLRMPLPDETLAPGTCRVFLCGDNSFSLSEGETLYLLAPTGEEMEAVPVSAAHADRSLQRQDNGAFVESFWISPGYPNGPEGYDAYCKTRGAASSLRIEEVMVSNRSYPPLYWSWYEPCDWVELCNTGTEALNLGGFVLADTLDSEKRWVFPERELAPGERLVIYCDEDTAGEDYSPSWNTGFSLASDHETLYLWDASGKLIDYVNLHDIPLNGSLGRREGENGFFYFSVPTPGEENFGGERRVSAAPTALEPDGVFEGVDTVTVTLRGEGEIHYTLDGTLPTIESPLYEGPFAFTQTAVVRAIACESGALPSEAGTWSYIINEHHTLPVLSLTVDDKAAFDLMYKRSMKIEALDASLALYDGVHSFSQRCGVGLRGNASLGENKKSLGVEFKNRYGGALSCDVFGNGLTQYTGLTIRAGQDYLSSIFRSEVLQDLALESEHLLSQQSKFCILYLNGEYWGIYCLKEDYSRNYYAQHRGVSKDSVEMQKFPAPEDSAFFRDIVWRTQTEPMTDELYNYLCEQLDMDSLIDWFLFEGFSANVDMYNNIRTFRSTENGYRWEFAFYDLDWALIYPPMNFGNLIFYGEAPGNPGTQMPPMLKSLITHPAFRDRALTRLSELSRTVMTNDRLLERIDYYAALLAPEVERNQSRWWVDLQRWSVDVEALRSFVVDNDWERHNVESLCRVMGVDDATRAQYFGW